MYTNSEIISFAGSTVPTKGRLTSFMEDNIVQIIRLHHLYSNCGLVVQKNAFQLGNNREEDETRMFVHLSKNTCV